MSDRLLSQRLRERRWRVGRAEGGARCPVRVSYSLTIKGADLDPALRELRVWVSAGRPEAGIRAIG